MIFVKRIAGLLVALSAMPNACFAQNGQQQGVVPVDVAPSAPLELCAPDAKPFENARDAYLCLVEEYHHVLDCAMGYFSSKGLSGQQVAQKIASDNGYEGLLEVSDGLVDEKNPYLQTAKNAGNGAAGVQALLAAISATGADDGDKSMQARLKRAKAAATVATYLAAETDGTCHVSDRLQKMIRQKTYADL